MVVLLPGCSRQAERLVGNARLLRGPGGLGRTSRAAEVADRDTWVETGTRAGGPVLLVANTGTFEAVTHLKVARWHVPDTSLTALSIRSVVLFAPALIPNDKLNTPTPITIQLGESDAPWDSTTIVWPGPGIATELGRDTANGNLFTVSLVLASPLDSLKKWAKNPSSVPGFQLRAASVVPGSVAAFQAGAVYIRVAYDHKVSGRDTTEVIDSPVTTDLYVRTPSTTLATGGEPMLYLGGHEGLAVPIRFQVPDLPPGASLNEGTLLLHVDSATDSIPFRTGNVTVDLEVRSLGADWLESATSNAEFAPATSPSVTVRSFAYHGVADSLIAIQVPVGMIRGWRAASSSNHGLLLTAVRGDAAPVILLDSRESSRPPQLRVSYTTSPKERF